jgi:hypothetical protein
MISSMHLGNRREDLRPWLREPWWAEIGSGTAALLWSLLTIVFAFRIFDLASMRVVLTVADEGVWQAIGIMLGLAQLAAAVADKPWLRWGIALVACWWWLFLLLAIGLAVHTPSLALYAVMAALNLVPACRLLRLRMP